MYLSVTGKSRYKNVSLSVKSKPSSTTSFSVTGKDKGHKASCLTALINSSVINKDKLNWRKRPSSRLALINSKTSGWLISKVAICAPRRPPAEDTVKHILSKISINDNGPEVVAPAPAT